MPPYSFKAENTPPAAHRVTDVAISRYDHVYEVDPMLMQEHVQQQKMPNWDFLRIVGGRADHLAWMHAHWAGTTLSGEELLAEIIAEEDTETGVKQDR